MPARVYFALHGAMQAEDELDPEGVILERARAIFDPEVPFVMSLDLHGIATARMFRHCPAFTALRTYPHVDFADTGARAARLLLRILDEGLRPVAARVWMPLLVRGDELITETGLYGGFLKRPRRSSASPACSRPGVFIGNPFTDVPELGSQAVVVTDGDAGSRAARRRSSWPTGSSTAAPTCRRSSCRSRVPHRCGHGERGAGDPDRCGRRAELGCHRRQPGHRGGAAGARLSAGASWRR